MNAKKPQLKPLKMPKHMAFERPNGIAEVQAKQAIQDMAVRNRQAQIGRQEGNVGDMNSGRNDAVIYDHKRG
jgi:hypothetical protein